jgi:hypothetical protein
MRKQGYPKLSEAQTMMQAPLSVSILGVFLFSCASAPAKPVKETPAPPPPAAPVATATPAPSEAPAVVPHVEPRKKLEAGQCVESFDCVDTVGFPPSGQRWTCLDGKCGKTKLPDLGQDQPSSGAASSTASNEETAPNKPTTKRHRSKRQ